MDDQVDHTRTALPEKKHVNGDHTVVNINEDSLSKTLVLPVSPFVVIPRHKLHEVVVEGNSGLGIENA